MEGVSTITLLTLSITSCIFNRRFTLVECSVHSLSMNYVVAYPLWRQAQQLSYFAKPLHQTLRHGKELSIYQLLAYPLHCIVLRRRKDAQDELFTSLMSTGVCKKLIDCCAYTLWGLATPYPYGVWGSMKMHEL